MFILFCIEREKMQLAIKLFLFLFFLCSGPSDLTHITEEPTPDYGLFDLAVIQTTRVSTDLNAIYTISNTSALTRADSITADTTTNSQPDLTASFDITRQPSDDPSEVLKKYYFNSMSNRYIQYHKKLVKDLI